MSKRFGRNQKRAMVAQLEEKASAIGALQEMAAGNRRQIQSMHDHVFQLEDAIRHTRDVLGEFFITLPPMTKELQQGVDALDIPISKPRDYYDRMPFGSCAELHHQVARFESLEAIRHDIQQDFEDLRGMMHIRFRTGAGLMSYAFNERSFRGIKRERAAAIIASGLRNYMLQNRSFFDRLGVK